MTYDPLGMRRASLNAMHAGATAYDNQPDLCVDTVYEVLLRHTHMGLFYIQLLRCTGYTFLLCPYCIGARGACQGLEHDQKLNNAVSVRTSRYGYRMYYHQTQQSVMLLHAPHQHVTWHSKATSIITWQ